MSKVQGDNEVDYEQDLDQLPAGWSWIALGEICDAINGRAFKSTEWRERGVPIIRIQNLKDPDASFNYFQGDLDDKHKVEAGDLLFAWSGTPGTSFGAHIWYGPNAALNQHIFNVQFDRKELDTKYLCYALNQNVSRYVAQAQGGVGLAHITKSKFMASKVPIAPLDQQKRIVAEIERQFSRLDEAVANLKRVKANLKRYKAAILKAAVEGRLVETEAELDRREGRSYETGEQLLQRILETRRSQWKGKGKYKEPAEPNTPDLPELPEGWVWVTAEQVCDPIASGSTPAAAEMYSESGEVPFIKVYNLTFDGALDFTVKPTFVKRATHEGLLNRSRVFPGDVLTNIVGPPLGKVSIAPDVHPEWNINQAIVTFRTTSGINNHLLAIWLMSSPVLRRLERTAKATAGQFNLQVTTCRKLAIPLPPIAEQRRIVAEVDRRLSVLHETEAQVEANLTRAERLRQSTLTAGFAGRFSTRAETVEKSSAVQRAPAYPVGLGSD